MAITYSSGIITVAGSKVSGTATSGAAKTLTDTSKSWTTNAYKFHIVWITGGTGAGQHNFILSNTATAITCYLAWTTNPDSTSTYVIGYSPADIVADQPSYATYLHEVAGADLKQQIKLNTDTGINVASGGYFGCCHNPKLIFEYEYRGLESVSGAHIVFGMLDNDREHGFKGGTIQCALSYNAASSGGKYATGIYHTMGMHGKAYFYGTKFESVTDFIYDGTLAATNRRNRYYNATGATHDGMTCRDCITTTFALTCENGDDFKYCDFADSDTYIHATGTNSNSTHNEQAYVSIHGGLAQNGATKRDLQFNGLLDNTKRVGRPLWLYQWSSTNNASIYVINFYPTNSYYSDILKGITFDSYTGYNPNGTVWLGYSANITVRDADGNLLDGVTVGCKDSKGNAGWFSAKGASYPYTPTMVGYKTTSSGLVTDAWVIKGRIKWNGTYNQSYGDPPNSHGAWYDANYPVNPWTLPLRKYGYQFLNLVQDFKDQSESAEVPAYLQDNDYVSADYATAWAYTGIAITGSSNTTALTASRTMQELYDYSQAWAVQGANILYSEQITTSNGTDFTLITGGLITGGQNLDLSTQRLSGGTIRYGATGTYSPKLGAITIDFAQAGTYNLSGADFGGHVTFTNSSGGNVTVELETGVDYTNTGPNITISEPQVYQSATISGLTAGTRIQLYDVTSSTELYNGTPTFPYTWTDPNPYSADRTIRLRAALVSGTTAKDFIKATIGTATETNPAISYMANQVDDEVYNDNAVDGSAVTGITFTDAATDIVNINIASGSVTWQSIYAAFAYWIFTETGIADDIAYVDAVDSANYRLTAMKIKNTSSPSVPLAITGGYGVDTTTGASIDLVDATGGTLVFAPDHVVNNVVTVTGSNVITGDIDDVTAKVQAGLTAQGYTTTRSEKLDNLDAQVSTAGGATADEVEDIVIANS